MSISEEYLRTFEVDGSGSKSRKLDVIRNSQETLKGIFAHITTTEKEIILALYPHFGCKIDALRQWHYIKSWYNTFVNYWHQLQRQISIIRRWFSVFAEFLISLSLKFKAKNTVHARRQDKRIFQYFNDGSQLYSTFSQSCKSQLTRNDWQLSQEQRR